MLIFCCKFKIFFYKFCKLQTKFFQFLSVFLLYRGNKGETARFRTGTTALSGGNNSVFGREQQRFRGEERRSACRATIVGSVFHYSGKHLPLQ